jgi:hypothetical protein
MKILETPNYTGNKQKTGSLVFDEKGRMHVFVTYCDVCHGKLGLSVPEARDFAKRYHDTSNKKRTKRLLKQIADRTI